MPDQLVLQPAAACRRADRPGGDESPGTLSGLVGFRDERLRIVDLGRFRTVVPGPIPATSPA
jgi:hypothetical protein